MWINMVENVESGTIDFFSDENVDQYGPKCGVIGFLLLVQNAGSQKKIYEVIESL